jgi:hypothetical protein
VSGGDTVDGMLQGSEVDGAEAGSVLEREKGETEEGSWCIGDDEAPGFPKLLNIHQTCGISVEI